MTLKREDGVQRFLLYGTVFLSGAAILMLEILGTRLVAPFFGSTIYVWSSLISVTILAIAAGHFAGGHWADRYPRRSSIAIILFLAAVCMVLLPYIDRPVLAWTSRFGLRTGPLLAALVLFFLPLAVLSVIHPFILKLRVSSLGHVARTSGAVNAAGALGSVVGALSTGFILIPYMALDLILYVYAAICATVSLSFLVSWKGRAGASVMIALLAAIGLCARSPYVPDGQVLFRQQSIMGEVAVVDKTYFRIMLVDGAVQSWVERATMQPSGAFAQMLPLALLHDPSPKDALVIGLGAGSVSTLLTEQGLFVDTVEIDERVIEAARHYFDFAGQAVRGDGRRFLREAPAHAYDIVVFDISTGDAFPAYMFTKENFEQARRVLRPEGLAVIHFAGQKDSRAVRSVKRTLREVFGHAVALHTGEDAMSSVVLMSSETALDREKLRAGIQRSALNNSLKGFYLGILDEKWDTSTDEGIVLTDRFNPLENWQIETMEEWRRYALKVFGDLSSL